MIHELRPSVLEQEGLVGALQQRLDAVESRSGVETRLLVDGAVELPMSIEQAFYRIAQEALNNALQHARPENIIVRVRCDSDGVTLAVEDDGVGFELPPRPDLLTQAGHFGLLGMRERATLLGGSIRIHTAPGEGTRVTVRLPARSPAS